MSKKINSLIIIGVSLVILCGSLLALILTAPEDEGGVDVDSGSAETYAITLIDTDKKAVSMYVKNQQASFTIKPGEGDQLYFAELPEFDMYEGFLKYLWENTSYFGASRELVATADVPMPSDEDLGFTNPMAEVLITYEDGSTAGFTVGNCLTGNNDIFYVRMNGSPSVYVATLHLAYFNNREHFFNDSIITLPRDAGGNYIPQVIDNIVLSGTNFGQTIKIMQNKDMDNATSVFYGSEFVITSPEKTLPNSTTLANLAYQLKQVDVNGVVCFNPTKDQLKQYGLDKPRAIVSYTSNGEAITMRAGKEDGVYTYIMKDGINAILSLQTSYCANWSTVSYSDLRDPSVFPRAIVSFKKITITSNETDKSYVFDVSLKEAEGGTGYDYVITCNGKAIDFKNFQKFVSTMTLTDVVDYNVSAQSSEPAMTISLEYFEAFGAANETVTFLPAGSRRYVCKINGNGNTAVASTYVDKLLADAEKLLAGEEIVSYI